MKILWFVPKWPHPAYDGATKAHMALLENWPSEKHQLDLIIFEEQNPTRRTTDKTQVDVLKKVCPFHELLVLPYSEISKHCHVLHSMFLRNPLPATVMKFCSKDAVTLFNQWSKGKKWDAVVFDGIHTAGPFIHDNDIRFPGDPIIITRTHNVETELWNQVSTQQKWPLSFIYKREAKKMERFESILYRNSKNVATVSLADAQKINLPNTVAIPIGMSMSSSIPAYDAGKTHDSYPLLFIGRLDWYPNTEGLIWFLDEVWPEVSARRPDLKLHIVGGFAGASLIEKIERSKQTTFHGRVPDVKPFYEAALMTLIPIFTGSGTRVKAIESARFKRTFISTSKGIEGVELHDGTHYTKKETAKEWIKELSELNPLTMSKMGEVLYNKIAEDFEQTICQKKFLKLLEK